MASNIDIERRLLERITVAHQDHQQQLASSAAESKKQAATFDANRNSESSTSFADQSATQNNTVVTSGSFDFKAFIAAAGKLLDASLEKATAVLNKLGVSKNTQSVAQQAVQQTLSVPNVITSAGTLRQHMSKRAQGQQAPKASSTVLTPEKMQQLPENVRTRVAESDKLVDEANMDEMSVTDFFQLFLGAQNTARTANFYLNSRHLFTPQEQKDFEEHEFDTTMRALANAGIYRNAALLISGLLQNSSQLQRGQTVEVPVDYLLEHGMFSPAINLRAQMTEPTPLGRTPTFRRSRLDEE